MSIPIGSSMRLSIADQDGHFVVIGPEPQRSEVERFLAEHPEIEQQAIAEERAQRIAVITGGTARGWDLAGNAGDRSSAVWMRGDRIIIDDPWADGEPSPEERMAALDLFRPGLKMIEAERLERRELSAAARPDAPLNRADRRAQEARQRKGRR